MKKIKAIEKTIYNLENNVYEYNWGNLDSCNCGVLAKTLINGKDVLSCGFKSINSVLQNPKYYLFSDRTHCLSTNEPLPEVYAALRDAEFTDSEMKELELLKSPQILKKIGVAELKHSDKSHLISYLKAWVEILKEDKPEVKEKIRYVSVPETITEQTKELILQ